MSTQAQEIASLCWLAGVPQHEVRVPIKIAALTYRQNDVVEAKSWTAARMAELEAATYTLDHRPIV